MKWHRGFGSISAVAIVLFVCLQAHARDDQIPVVEAPPVEEAQPVFDPQGTVEPTLRDVMAELTRLRQEVVRLQELLDAHLSSEAGDLRTENERLRLEIRDLSIQKGRALPPLPMPDKELLKGLSETEPIRPRDRKQIEEAGSREKPAEGTETKVDSNPPPPAEFKHEVLAEWGRTPTDAAKSIPKAGSLKGMICVVPPGSLDEDLIALARKLHKQFESYDNINIEMFDDADAARAFKDNRSSGGAHAPSEHRVLSISKHGASGRDVTLLIKGKQVMEVPPQE